MLKIDANIDEKIDLIFDGILVDVGSKRLPKPSKNHPKNDTKKESEKVTKKAKQNKPELA